jgi:hypothetical protein
MADFWGRAWLRLKGPAGGHQMFIAHALPGGNQLRVLNSIGSLTVTGNVATGDPIFNSTVAIPQETWFCFEWHVNATATHLYKDGTEVMTTMGGKATTMPGETGITSLILGFQRFQTGSAASDLWIDDVAVDTNQIGCNVI